MIPHDRRAARHAEIERDHRVVAAALVAGLRRIARCTAADLEEVCHRVEDTIAESRAACRRLNDARINLRGQRNARWDDSQGLPAPLVWYRHRGNYHGEFASMAALGVVLSQAWSVGDDVADRADAASIAEELHLRGELWTFVHDGALHVFSKPVSLSDAALARSRVSTDLRPASHSAPPDPSIDNLTKENVIMITRLTFFHAALLLGCSPPTALQLAADNDAHQTPAGTPRTMGAIANDLLALIDSTPEPDAYGRHLVTMAGELVMVARLAATSDDAVARITCSGRYQSAACWNVSCECETLTACATVSKWCEAIVGEESGRSCSKATRSGCL